MSVKKHNIFASEVFKILIKKELMFFTNGCPSLATRVGALLFTIEKAIYNRKIKTKKLKGYVQLIFVDFFLCQSRNITFLQVKFLKF